MRKTYKPHPLSELLPPMSESEYQALKADIEMNGQVEDILLLDGKILDGRHRSRACAELGIEPRVKDYKLKTSPAQYVYSKAVHRNMSDTQKACSALRFDAEFSKDASERSKRGKPSEETEKGLSREKAASLFGVSGRYVQDAKYVFERDSKLFQKCFDGGEVLTRAKREILRGERRKDNVRRASVVTAATAVPGNVWEIRHGDCVQHLKTGVPQKSYRLAFADSPYNIGVDYGDGKKADQRDPAEFLKWCGEWMGGVYQALTSDGSFWVLINHEWASHFEILLEKSDFHIRAWITWYESFGNNCLNNFNRTSRRLFYCVKNKGDFVFNAEHFNRPSDRQAIHGDKRANPAGKIWDDVWGINPPIPRLVENAAERLPDFPTQLPLALLRPIVAGCSNPGDMVLDPFNGSGTTGEAAISLGRKYLGLEIQKKFVEAARMRLSMVVPAKK